MFAKYLLYSRALIRAVLDEHLATGTENTAAVSRKCPNIPQAIKAGFQRTSRFMPQSVQCGIVTADIRRIAHDQIEGPAANWRDPVALEELHIAGIELPGILRCDCEGRGADIRRRYLTVRSFAGNCQGNCTAARSKVENSSSGIPVDPIECQLDQQFSFRSRHQRVGRHHHLQGPELLLARYIGQRNAVGPSRDQCRKTRASHCVHNVVGMAEQIAAINVERKGKQDFRIQSGAVTD